MEESDPHLFKIFSILLLELELAIISESVIDYEDAQFSLKLSWTRIVFELNKTEQCKSYICKGRVEYAGSFSWDG